jgi:hypothetical protein
MHEMKSISYTALLCHSDLETFWTTLFQSSLRTPTLSALGYSNVHSMCTTVSVWLTFNTTIHWFREGNIRFQPCSLLRKWRCDLRLDESGKGPCYKSFSVISAHFYLFTQLWISKYVFGWINLTSPGSTFTSILSLWIFCKPAFPKLFPATSTLTGRREEDLFVFQVFSFPSRCFFLMLSRQTIIHSRLKSNVSWNKE